MAVSFCQNNWKEYSLCKEGMIATEDPTLRILEGLGFFVSDEEVGDDDLEDEESNQASGGADILLLRTLLSEFLRLVCKGGGVRPSPVGTGSFTNSGRLSNAVGSSICILSCTGSGIASRMNSGNDRSASGSLPFIRGVVPGGARAASCECSLPASACCISCSTKASRCPSLQ